MKLDSETYNDQIADLNFHYIRDLGESIRARLFPTPGRDGIVPYPLPAGIAYQPDNGAAYDLVFVSIRTIRQLGTLFSDTRDDLARPVPSGCFNGNWEVDPGYILVVKANGTSSDFAYPFDLSFGHSQNVNYVLANTGIGWSNACALTALFRAVAGVELLD